MANDALGGKVMGPFPSPGPAADEMEFHMLDVTTHYNDLCNITDSAINVRVVTSNPANPNGGIANDNVRIK